MAYGLKVLRILPLISQVTAGGGHIVVKPEFYRLNTGKNVGKVLLFCHHVEGEDDKKLVYVVDNKDDLRRELDLNADLVLEAKSDLPVVREMQILPEPTPYKEEKVLPFWHN